MSGWTNKAKADLFKQLYQRSVSLPAHYYIVLVTSDHIPGPDTNTMADLTEIPEGNGYEAGGYELSPNSVDFDYVEEDDDENLGSVQIRDIVWEADGGSIPATGHAAYAVMTDDNATLANRKVLHYWSLGGERSVQDTYPFRLINLEIRASEV
jgi:hypothetical protein